MKKLHLILFLAIAVIGLTRCSSDVELNAPYDSRTVVFGLLDPGLDTQWVKINRTWLGDGNNIDIAAIQDSSEYQEGAFDGRVEEWLNGSLVASYPIKDTLVENKNTNGIFFGPEQTVYYFATPGGLNADAEFLLNLDFPNDDDVQATTDLINSETGFITFPFTPSEVPTFNGVQFANVTQFNTTYTTNTFKWLTSDNAFRYESLLRIYVKELVYTDDQWTDLVEERNLSLDWVIGTDRTTDTDLDVQREVNGQGFYNFLAASLEDNDNIRREIGYWDTNLSKVRVFDFVVTMANEELDTYLDINEPVTNIVQERPDYTNVSNGIGLWASRAQVIQRGVNISSSSIRALIESDITGHLNFCSPNPNDPDLGCN